MNRKPNFLVISIVVLILSMSLLTACQPQTTPITGADRDAVLVYAQPKVDRLIQGMQSGDYQTFSTDFNPEMTSGLTEESFGEMLQTFDEKIGAYQSAEVTAVEQTGNFVAVTYNLVFERSDRVTMRVVFDETEPHNIAGLWYNSPDLE
jgi:hypothetical protein